MSRLIIKIMLFASMILCGLPLMAKEIYLRCDVSGIVQIDITKKEKLGKRSIGVLIKEIQNAITFDITGMPRGSMSIYASKSFTKYDNGYSSGSIDEKTIQALSVRKLDSALVTEIIDISRIDGFITLSSSLTQVSPMDARGFEVSGHCKPSRSKQLF